MTTCKKSSRGETVGSSKYYGRETRRTVTRRPDSQSLKGLTLSDDVHTKPFRWSTSINLIHLMGCIHQSQSPRFDSKKGGELRCKF